MKRLLTIILILCSFSAIGQITSASYTNKGATVPFLNASIIKINGLSIAPKLYFQNTIDSLNKALATGLVKLTTGTGKLSIITDNSTNWNTAYSWVNTNGANAVTAYGWGNWASNFGTTSGKIAQGNDSRINNGQTAYGWGNHAGLYKGIADSINPSGFATQYDLSVFQPSQWTTSGSDIYYTTGKVGIAINIPLGAIHAANSSVTGTALFERTSQTTDAMRNGLRSLATKTSAMGDGFGSSIQFNVRDDDAVINPIGAIGAVRDSSDNSGALVFNSYKKGVDVERMRIDRNGLVGIGTASPAYKLDVKGGINSDSLLIGGVKKNTVWDAKQAALVSGTNIKTINSTSLLGSGDIAISGSSQWTTSGSDIYYNTGNIGIGITTPYNQLDVKGIIGTEDDDNNKLTLGYDVLGAENGLCNYTIIAGYYDKKFRYGGYSDVNGITIDSTTTNIGIGTLTPAYKLDVNGGVNSDSLFINGTRKDLVWDAKQNALTNPVTGTGTANYVSKWTATGTQGNSLFQDDGTYVGIGIAPSSSYILNIGSGLVKFNGGITGMTTALASSYFSSPMTRNADITTQAATSANISIYPQDKDAPYIRFGAGNDNTIFTTEWARFITGGNLGLGTTTPTNIISLNGNSAQKIWMERHTTANTAGNTLTIQSGSATSGATDKDGGMLTISPGASTGTGKSSVRIQGLTRANSTGTTDNSLVDRYIVPSRKYLTDNSAVGLFDVTLGSNQTTGGQVNYSIHVTDGTDYQVHTGIVVWGAVSKGTAITANFNHATAVGGLELDVVSAGTITDTWSVVEADGGKITLTINANSSLSTPTIWIEYTITNNGSTAITQL